MGLVTLKNFLFGRMRPIDRKPINERAESTMSDDTIIGADLERQPLLGTRTISTASMGTVASKATTSSSDGESSRRLRIDARVISDATIGLSDGLTVPFALTAGLSALGQTKVVIFGGMAELIAGAISMGLGGYLGAKSEA